MENVPGSSGPSEREDAVEDPRPHMGETPPTDEIPTTTATPPGGYPPPPGYAPPLGYGWAGGPMPTSGVPPFSVQMRNKGAFTKFFTSATVAWVLVILLVGAVTGLSVALATEGPVPIRAIAPSYGAIRNNPPFPGGGAFGANGPPFAHAFGNLGVAGTVSSVRSGSFTVTSSSGQVVTVDEQASTTYATFGSSATSSAVKKGARVLVQGTRTGNTVEATRVIVLPPGPLFGSGPPG